MNKYKYKPITLEELLILQDEYDDIQVPDSIYTYGLSPKEINQFNTIKRYGTKKAYIFAKNAGNTATYFSVASNMKKSKYNG